MNNYCVSCGIPIPPGQRNCSMCYGDIDHGRDGYYREYMEEMARQEMEHEQSGEGKDE